MRFKMEIPERSGVSGHKSFAIGSKKSTYYHYLDSPQGYNFESMQVLHYGIPQFLIHKVKPYGIF
jgi:hypothetical protein